MGNNIKKIKSDEIKKLYIIGDKLGTGSFATVKRAVRKSDGKVFAIKIIKKSKLAPDELAVVHDEVTIMGKIVHPHCVRMYEMFETSKKLYMVLELLEGGELFDRIVEEGSFSEAKAAVLIKSVASALRYLHDIGIVHRDLKPENLLYTKAGDEGEVKITDFGLAKFKENTNFMTTACGTPGYVAPEVLEGGMYGKEVDMWSLGVILYILLCGFPPFYHENTGQLYNQIKKGDYSFPDPYWKKVSPAAKRLVRGLLTVNPKKRLTADQVLANEWVKGAAPDQEMAPEMMHAMKVFTARTKFQRGIQMVVAVNRFKKALDNLNEQRKTEEKRSK